MPAGAVVLFACNNLWAKHAYPGFWTGKISDFCYMLFMPSLWAFLFHWSPLVQRRRFRWTVAALATGVPFVLLKTSAPFSNWVNGFIGHFWMFWGLAARPNLLDVSDLWALLVLPLAVYYGLTYEQRHLPIFENEFSEGART